MKHAIQRAETAAEIAALLEQRHSVDDSHHCPHGRPTELVFTREELDKRFTTEAALGKITVVIDPGSTPPPHAAGRRRLFY